MAGQSHGFTEALAQPGCFQKDPDTFEPSEELMLQQETEMEKAPHALCGEESSAMHRRQPQSQEHQFRPSTQSKLVSAMASYTTVSAAGCISSSESHSKIQSHSCTGKPNPLTST